MPPPKIIIDARHITADLSGIGRYTHGLLQGLAKLDHPYDVFALVRRPDETDRIGGLPDTIKTIEFNHSVWSIRSQLALPRLIRRLGASLIHVPYLHVPVLPHTARAIVTVHDLIPTALKHELDRSRKTRYRYAWSLWSRLQYHRADAVVTVSDYSSHQLETVAHVPVEKIHRIYNGVTGGGSAMEEPELRRKFGIKGRIVSYVGRHDPYKNVGGLVRAFELSCEQLEEDVVLVIAGKIDPRYPHASKLAKASPFHKRIIFTGYLPEAERLALLRASSVFAFPSMHEGFGLPPLEAMAEGVPVIASNATSLPEVLGDAALFVNPRNPESLADAITKILTDDQTAVRLRSAGLAQAARYTWKRCAEEHAAVYDVVLSTVH